MVTPFVGPRSLLRGRCLPPQVEVDTVVVVVARYRVAVVAILDDVNGRVRQENGPLAGHGGRSLDRRFGGLGEEYGI